MGEIKKEEGFERTEGDEMGEEALHLKSSQQVLNPKYAIHSVITYL